MTPSGRLLLGLLVLCLPALAGAAVPPAAEIRRDFATLAGETSPRSITTEEWESASFALFQSADKDKDNALAATELGDGAITRSAFAAADENRDDKLSVSEFMQVRRAVFRATDLNRDDALTFFEFELLVLLGQVGWNDTNRNGRIEVSELKAALLGAFAVLDANRDGKLDKEEAAYLSPNQWRTGDGNGDAALTAEEFLHGYLVTLGAI